MMESTIFGADSPITVRETFEKTQPSFSDHINDQIVQLVKMNSAFSHDSAIAFIIKNLCGYDNPINNHFYAELYLASVLESKRSIDEAIICYSRVGALMGKVLEVERLQNRGQIGPAMQIITSVVDRPQPEEDTIGGVKLTPGGAFHLMTDRMAWEILKGLK